MKLEVGKKTKGKKYFKICKYTNDEFERTLLNTSDFCKELGIHRRTLWRRLRDYEKNKVGD